mgnify:FL=1
MLPKRYSFSYRNDTTNEPISKVYGWSRLEVAKHFAYCKQLKLKDFLKIFKISK